MRLLFYKSKTNKQTARSLLSTVFTTEVVKPPLIPEPEVVEPSFAEVEARDIFVGQWDSGNADDPDDRQVFDIIVVSCVHQGFAAVVQPLPARTSYIGRWRLQP